MHFTYKRRGTLIMLSCIIGVLILPQSRGDTGGGHNHGAEGQKEDNHPEGRPAGTLQREEPEERRHEMAAKYQSISLAH